MGMAPLLALLAPREGAAAARLLAAEEFDEVSGKEEGEADNKASRDDGVGRALDRETASRAVRQMLSSLLTEGLLLGVSEGLLVGEGLPVGDAAPEEEAVAKPAAVPSVRPSTGTAPAPPTRPRPRGPAARRA